MEMKLNLMLNFVLSNAPFVLTLLALLIGLLRCFSANVRINATCFEGFLAYLFLLPIGIGGLWGFTMHSFFHQLADADIGWAWSPFEYEVAIANLGMGLLGLGAFHASAGFRKATALFITCFGWGAAVGHAYQMMTAHNFAPGNAGIIFYTDIFIPILIWVFMFLKKKNEE